MILLTGATGNTGSQIAERLKGLGVPFVAMARRASARSALEARGFPTISGDFDDRESLQRALRGIERTYLVSTPDGTLTARECTFIEEAKRAGVRHIVKCSAILADGTSESPNLRSHATIERALRASGLEWTILRPHAFMQTFTLFSWSLVCEAGVVSAPHGDGAMALVDVRDVAALAVKALTEPGHEGRLYEVSGPQALTMWDMADALSKVLGRPVSYVEGSPRSMELMMRVLGVPDVPRAHVRAASKLVRENRVGEVTDTLAEHGVTATTYEQFLEDWVAGRTGGGSSFEVPKTRFVRALTVLMPKMMRMRIAIGGRPLRPA